MARESFRDMRGATMSWAGRTFHSCAWSLVRANRDTSVSTTISISGSRVPLAKQRTNSCAAVISGARAIRVSYQRHRAVNCAQYRLWCARATRRKCTGTSRVPTRALSWAAEARGAAWLHPPTAKHQNPSPSGLSTRYTALAQAEYSTRQRPSTSSPSLKSNNPALGRIFSTCGLPRAALGGWRILLLMRRLSTRQLFSTLVFTFMILLAASLLQAWTGPTAAPTGNNIAAPVNVGTADQVKDGGLSVNGLRAYGTTIVDKLGVNIPDADPPTLPVVALDVKGTLRIADGGELCQAVTEGAQRYNTTSNVMEYCDGTGWIGFGP